MTPATDAAREARAREVLAKHLEADGYLALAKSALTGAGMDSSLRAMLAFADTEAASQPREGEVAEALGHLEWLCSIAYNEGGAHELGYDPLAVVRKALTQRPPEQAGGVSAEVDRLRKALHEIANIRPIGATAHQSTCALMEMIACRALSAAPTPPDAGPGEIPAGTIWKPWHGGRKPADWSGEAVRFRNDEVVHAPPAGTIWKLGWDHNYGPDDIIAYTPKAPPQTPQDAGIGSDGAGEVERLRVLLAERSEVACDAECNGDLGIHEKGCRDATLALATQPGDGGRS